MDAWYLLALGLLLVAAGIFGLVTTLRSLPGALSRRSRDRLATLARARHGRLETPVAGEPPVLRYHCTDGEAAFRIEGDQGPVRLEIPLPFHLPPVFALRSAGGGRTVFGRGRVDAVRTGDTEFDAAFQILTNNPDLVVRLLDDDLRKRLLDLPTLLHPSSRRLSISVAARQIRLECPLVHDDHADFVAFLAGADHVGAAILAALGFGRADAGIPDGELLMCKPLELAEGTCRVCGEALGSGAVQCCRCHTLHHRDCWEYFGSCSIFGCASRDCAAAESTPS